MNIYVGSLHYDVSEEQLKEIFEEYGEVTSVRIITDKYSGKSKGFGFIEMPNEAEAKNAIEDLKGAEVKGRTIIVNESIERKDNNNRRSGGGGGGNFRRDNNRRPGGGGGNRRDNNRSNY